jgi:uridine kinase
MTPSLVIGIAGGTGSGKTTVVERLTAGVFGPQICVLPHDAYYRNFELLPKVTEEMRNWDHPDALDNRLFVEHIDQLRAGQPIDRPVYDFSVHHRTAETIRVTPRPILLLEGILLFAIPTICERISLRVYIDTPSDVRIVRRTVRDVEERGRTARSVVDQYIQTVRPMHEQFVEPSRYSAHLWIPWISDNPEAIEVLSARIAYELSQGR